MRFEEGDLVGVLTTEPLDRVLDYKAPQGGCWQGAFVEVPLGPRRVLGVVWEKGRGDWDLAKVRPITRVIDVPPLGESLRIFLQKAAAYTLTPLPLMLRLATRAPGLLSPQAMQKIYKLGDREPARLTPARRKVLAVLEEFTGSAFTLGEVAEVAGVSPSVIKGLVAQGAVQEMQSPRDLPYLPLDPTRPGKTLTEDQAKAATALRVGINAEVYGTTLLKGVTGSGKTEVYLEAVAACLAKGRQALVLLPEIALSAEFLTRVQARFGAKPAEWHSGVTLTERRRCWRMVAEGGAQLVVGARSALFLPFQDLGLIVVDEEHDTSYKQEDGVLYNARDMAVLRASLTAAQVVLASATPALESWVNARVGKYKQLDLEARFGAAIMPEMAAIDMRTQATPAGRWVSPKLAQEMATRLKTGEQSLIFLNRRGYAPVTLCRACGQQIECKHCDAKMVEHKFLNQLMCHQCGATMPMPSVCPNPECGAEGKLTPVGPGVERICEEITTLFPEARIAILSSDLFGTARELKAKIAEIAEGSADIVIGTQLVAKGHNFPLLTLVGVIDADLALQGSDLRAAERTFQLMRQVAGRAGRAARKGVAFLQTFQPEHPVIRAILSGDDGAFWAAEAAEREAAGMPPFGRLAGIILSDPDLQVVFDVGNALVRHRTPLKAIGAEVFGPAPAPIARVRGRHRVRLLVKAAKEVNLQAALKEWVARHKLPKSTRLTIDIDPQSFY